MAEENNVEWRVEGELEAMFVGLLVEFGYKKFNLIVQEKSSLERTLTYTSHDSYAEMNKEIKRYIAEGVLDKHIQKEDNYLMYSMGHTCKKHPDFYEAPGYNEVLLLPVDINATIEWTALHEDEIKDVLEELKPRSKKAKKSKK